MVDGWNHCLERAGFHMRHFSFSITIKPAALRAPQMAALASNWTSGEKNLRTKTEPKTADECRSPCKKDMETTRVRTFNLRFSSFNKYLNT